MTALAAAASFRAAWAEQLKLHFRCFKNTDIIGGIRFTALQLTAITLVPALAPVDASVTNATATVDDADAIRAKQRRVAVLTLALAVICTVATLFVVWYMCVLTTCQRRSSCNGALSLQDLWSRS